MATFITELSDLFHFKRSIVAGYSALAITITVSISTGSLASESRNYITTVELSDSTILKGYADFEWQSDQVVSGKICIYRAAEVLDGKL